MQPVTDVFMQGVKPQGLQRGRGGFLRSADDAPYVTDPSGAMTKLNGNKPELITLCVERGITVPDKVTVAQLHELLGKRPCRVKYGSPSNYGREIDPAAELVKYKQRLSFLGIGMDTALAEQCRDLTLLDADSPEFKQAADKIAVEADKLTRSWLAADRGTHGHLLCERYDRDEDWRDLREAGEALGINFATQLAVIRKWHTMLAANGLEILAIEAPCVDDKWRLAGTLDRIVRTTRDLTFVKPSGELVVISENARLIGDLKFGKVRLPHAIQIASYAQSVPYDTETETRGEWGYEIDQEHALLFHGSFDPPSFELVWVDLVAGREHGGECVVQAKAWAARDDVFSVAQLCGAGRSQVAAEESEIVEGGATANAIPASSPSTPLVGEGLADDLHPSPTPEVEGGDSAEWAALPAAKAKAAPPSTPSPLLAATAAGEERVFADATSPAQVAFSMSPQRVVDEFATTATEWPVPSPARLALVQARDQLAVAPDEGADLGEGYVELWDALKALFDALDPAARSWRGELVGEATRRHVPFHAQVVRTERTYQINRGVIALCAQGADKDEVLRAILALVIGDVALFPSIHPGHALGSLTAAEATRFADLVDAYMHDRLRAYLDDKQVYRLRELSPA